jgi:hypothetical protein
LSTGHQRVSSLLDREKNVHGSKPSSGKVALAHVRRLQGTCNIGVDSHGIKMGGARWGSCGGARWVGGGVVVGQGMAPWEGDERGSGLHAGVSGVGLAAGVVERGHGTRRWVGRWRAGCQTWTVLAADEEDGVTAGDGESSTESPCSTGTGIVRFPGSPTAGTESPGMWCCASLLG